MISTLADACIALAIGSVDYLRQFSEAVDANFQRRKWT
jgi:hypothetical protein